MIIINLLLSSVLCERIKPQIDKPNLVSDKLVNTNQNNHHTGEVRRKKMITVLTNNIHHFLILVSWSAKLETPVYPSCKTAHN